MPLVSPAKKACHPRSLVLGFQGSWSGGWGRRQKRVFPSRLAVKVEDLDSWAGGGEIQGPVAAPGLAQRADEPLCPAASLVWGWGLRTVISYSMGVHMPPTAPLCPGQGFGGGVLQEHTRSSSLGAQHLAQSLLLAVPPVKSAVSNLTSAPGVQALKWGRMPLWLSAL